MFERVISQTIQRISNEVLRERSLISLSDILDDERIPTRLKPFFATEVRWWLYNESLGRTATRRFDYEQPELASLVNYFEQVQFKYARFERDEFLAVLDSAVKLTYNYLCRPQTTLKWYIFRGQPVRPLEEVMLRFDALSDYEYFRNVFIDWVESKQNERATFDAISATEFERIIRRTDDQILLNCTVEDLLSIMTPLFEFIGEGEAQRVPLDALVIFFDDKNIKRLVDHLERHRDRGHEFTTREEFVSILDELLSVADDEPENDFSQVYQNDELDDVVRRHLGSGGQPEEGYEDSGAYAPVDAPPTAPTPASVPASGPAGNGLNGDLHAAGSAPSTLEHDEPEPVYEHVEAASDDVVAREEDRAMRGSPANATSAGEQAGRTGSVGSPAMQHVADERSIPSASPGPVDPVRAPLEPVGPPGIDEEAIEEERERIGSAPRHDDLGRQSVASPAERGEDIGHEETGGAEHHGAAVIPSLMEEAATIEAPAEEPVGQDARGAGATEPGMVAPDIAAPGTAPTGDVHTDNAPRPATPSEPAPAPMPAAPAADTPAAPTPDAPTPDAPAASAAAPQFGDVRRYIDPSLERKVIKKIFGKNRAEYDQAIQKLNAADNWRVASQVLDELFIRFDVDPYSRTAVRFTDSVYGRYLSRGE